jgi:cell division protein FtsA
MVGKKLKTRHDIIVALDIGTTKVCCFSGKIDPTGSIRIVGIGYQLARGMRQGVVVDMDEAETSIRSAVDTAEQMTGEKIRQVLLNITGSQIQSTNLSINVHLNGHVIGPQDINRMINHASAQISGKEGIELLHAIPVNFTIDGNEGVHDPEGMFGDKAVATIHMISASQGPLKNLTNVVHRSHLRIENRIFSAYASGLACLVEDEMELGSICIDFGGGTTNIAIFQGGQLTHVESIPIGGIHVTKDIARGLSTSIAQAERLKTLYGNTMFSSSDDREILKVPLVGEEDEGNVNSISRSTLVQIIQPRIEETLEIIRSRLDASGYALSSGKRIVITGGAAQMQGIREFASQIFDKQVRIGKPIGFNGLPEATSGPAFSTSAGLLRYAMLNPSKENTHQMDGDSLSGRGKIGHMLDWLRKNF